MNASLFIQIKRFQQEGAKIQACNEQEKDLNLTLLHWDEYSHAYFLNEKDSFDFDH